MLRRIDDQPSFCTPSLLQQRTVGVGRGADLPGKAGGSWCSAAQIFLVGMNHHAQFAEIGDLEEIEIRADDVAQVDVLLDDGAVEGRSHLHPGPLAFLFQIAFALCFDTRVWPPP